MKRKLFSALWLAVLLSSCEFTREPTLPTWEMDVLGPLTKSQISLKDFEGISDLEFDASISMGQLIPGFNDGTAYPFIPASTIPQAGPFDVVSSQFGAVTFESGSLSLEFLNNLPVAINSADVEVISDGEPLFVINLPSIQSGASYSAPAIDLAGKRFGKSLKSVIKNLSTAAKNSPGVINSSHRVVIQLKTTKSVAKSIEFKAGTSFTTSSESPINFNSDEINTVSIVGAINFLANNGLPLNCKVQIYYLNEAKTKIDSLFVGSQSITSAQINNQTGRPIQPTTSKLSTQLTKQKFDILEGAEFVLTQVEVVAPDAPAIVTVENTDLLLIQTVGDFKVTVSKR